MSEIKAWFLKSKDLYLKQELLYDRLEVICVTESEIDNFLTSQAANTENQDEFEISHIL